MNRIRQGTTSNFHAFERKLYVLQSLILINEICVLICIDQFINIIHIFMRFQATCGSSILSSLLPQPNNAYVVASSALKTFKFYSCSAFTLLLLVCWRCHNCNVQRKVWLYLLNIYLLFNVFQYQGMQLYSSVTSDSRIFSYITHFRSLNNLSHTHYLCEVTHHFVL